MQKVEWTDTHCHLDQFPDPQAVIAEALALHVTRAVAVSEGLDSMQKVLELKRRFPEFVLAGCALHPARIPEMSDREVEEGLKFLEAHLSDVDVIGETGLDYKYATTAEGKKRQEEILHSHFALAARAQIPVNLHSRRAQRQTMEQAIYFHKRERLSAQLHWFTSSVRLVEVCNAEGIFISVGPAVLTQVEVERVVEKIRTELLLLESDAPVEFSGLPATPAQVAEVAQKVAEIKKVSLEELSAILTANFNRYLGKSC